MQGGVLVEIYRKQDLIIAGNSIGIKHDLNCHDCPAHLHDYIEIVYIADGEAIQEINGISYPVRRGDMLFINRGATHAFRSEGGFSHYEVFFSPQILESDALTEENILALLSLSVFDRMRKDRDGGVVHFHGEDRQEIEFILAAILRERALTYENAKSVIENYFSILLTKMLRNAESSVALSADILDSLRAHIDEHPEEKYSLSELAAKCFYHPAYFSRTFKSRFGLSPIEYVRSRRISRAAELLTSTDLSVEAIMAQIGFSDRSTFYQAFAKVHGMTPAQYRRENKK